MQVDEHALGVGHELGRGLGEDAREHANRVGDVGTRLRDEYSGPRRPNRFKSSRAARLLSPATRKDAKV